MRLVASLSDSTRGVWNITAAALLSSLIPVTLAYLVDDADPMHVGFGVVIGYVISVGLQYQRLAQRMNARTASANPISYRRIWNHIRDNRIPIWSIAFPIALYALASCDYLVFAWSIAHIDAAVVASLYEVWPMMWLIGMQFIDRRRFGPHDESRRSLDTYFLMALCVPAVALLISSGRSHGTVDGAVTTQALALAGGVLAPLLGALGVSSYWFVDRLIYARRSLKNTQPHVYRTWGMIEDGEEHGAHLEELEELLSHVCVVVARFVLLPFLIVFLVASNGSARWLVSWPLWGGLLAGACLYGTSSILLRRAHFVTKRREIISLQYLSPVLALFWLASLLGIDIGRLDFLIIGTMVVVAVNMLINVDPEARQAQEELETPELEPSLESFTPRSETVPAPTVSARHSLRALVLSLIGCGTFIFFREEFFPVSDLGWTPGNYWAVLALASTVFALLLAFRLTRVEQLLLAEDYRTLGLVRRVEMLPEAWFDNASNSDTKIFLVGWVRELNRAADFDRYQQCYMEAHNAIHRLLLRLHDSNMELEGNERESVASIRTELDALAHERQHAREFAERIALWLIGAVIVALAVSVPPEETAWAQLLSESFAFVLASVVIFLLAHLADLRRSRANEILRDRNPQWIGLPEGLYVRFREDSDVVWQRVFAGIIVTGIVSTLVLLLAWDRLV